MSVLPSPEHKADYVQDMFAHIAPGYDRANRAMTFGMDLGWREAAIAKGAPPIDGYALDVGTGTGDFLPLLAAWMPHGLAVGVDFSLPMMRTGWPKLDHLPPAGRVPPGQAAFVGGNALQLPFPDNRFDAITTGFVMRNVTDISAALREMWRVTRSGGVLACLEVARPRNPLLRLGHWLYFEGVVPLIGGTLSGQQRFYTYLPQSARDFPPPDQLAAMMHNAGWQHVHYQIYSMGAVAIHTGTKL